MNDYSLGELARMLDDAVNALRRIVDVLERDLGRDEPHGWPAPAPDPPFERAEPWARLNHDRNEEPPMIELALLLAAVALVALMLKAARR